MTQSSPEFPEMRAEVISAVRALADPDYQWRVWVGQDFPHADFFDDFSLNVNILGDAAVLDDPEGAVGRVLVSQSEAEAMRVLDERLQQALTAVGRVAADEAYLRSPEWEGVVEAACRALQVLVPPELGPPSHG